MDQPSPSVRRDLESGRPARSDWASRPITDRRRARRPAAAAGTAALLGRIGAIVYSGSFFVIALFFQLLWRYATGRGRLLAGDYNREAVESITRQYAFGPFSYIIALVIGLGSATASLIVNMLLAIFFALPPSIMRRT